MVRHTGLDDASVIGACVQSIRSTPRCKALCGISPNGSICSVRMTGEDDGQVLAEHYEGEGFALPMTIIIVDRANNAARITVTASGASWH